VGGKALVTESQSPLALAEGETGGRREAAGEARGSAAGSAAGGSAGGVAVGTSERRRTLLTGVRRGTLRQVGDERRRALGQGEGTAHHSHSSDGGELHCDWCGLIVRYRSKKRRNLGENQTWIYGWYIKDRFYSSGKSFGGRRAGL
jgi:hypothetical protein